MTQKTILVILISCLLTPIFLNAEEQKPFPILLNIPLSGNASYYGEEARKAAELALEELPEKNVSLIIEDDQLNPTKSIANYKKYPEAKALISFSSSTANVLAPLAEQEQKIQLAIASDPKVIKDRKFSFLHWVIAKEEVRALREEIIRRGYHRIAVIHTEHEGSNAIVDAVNNDFKENNLESKLILQESYLPDNFDFKNFIIKAKQKNADSVIVVLFPGGLSNFTKQARQLKLDVPFAGVETFEDESEVKAAQGTLLNQWYVNSDVPSDNFINSFKKKYNSYPSAYTANIYDSIKLLSQAVTLYGTDTSKIAHFLATLKDYQGACGQYSTTGDNRFTLKATIKVVTKDGFPKL